MTQKQRFADSLKDLQVRVPLVPLLAPVGLQRLVVLADLLLPAGQFPRAHRDSRADLAPHAAPAVLAPRAHRDSRADLAPHAAPAVLAPRAHRNSRAVQVLHAAPVVLAPHILLNHRNCNGRKNYILPLHQCLYTGKNYQIRNWLKAVLCFDYSSFPCQTDLAD